MTKRCTHCRKTKQITEFYKHTGLKSGLRSFCKSCDSSKRIRQKTLNNKPKQKMYADYLQDEKDKKMKKWLKKIKKKQT